MPVYKECSNLKDQLANPRECAVTSEGSQQMLPVIWPSTASPVKAWWTALTDICECLFRGAWEGIITAKPTVETNIN